MASANPLFTIQTSTLWASGDSSTFLGTGGPGYDPFLGTWNGVVSSSLIAQESFIDQLLGVDAGDQVVFAIVLQNFGSAAGYNLKLRDTLPVGFAIPADGADVLVTDGAGNILSTSGNLFDLAGGLTLAAPVAPYNDTSGTNVVLVTFTLDASTAMAAPLALTSNGAQILSYAASNGGPNLASGTGLGATTQITSRPIAVTSTANQQAMPLVSGKTDSFDITVTLPEGTVQDLRINELLPAAGNAQFSLVSAQIIQFGGHLSASLPVMTQPDGSILLGTVTDTPDNLETTDDKITIRVTVRNGGTTSGTGTLNTVVSAADPNAAGQRWSTTVTNTAPLATPDVPPSLGGISARQVTTSTTPVSPFYTLTVTDPDVAQIETLTVHLSNPALGTITGPGLVKNANGDGVLSGLVGDVQAAARRLSFTPASGATGTETFTLTVDDGAGGSASNAQTTLSIAAATNPSSLAQFATSSDTVLVSGATGSSTFAQVQTYSGPLDGIGSQFLYDGQAPLAIVAQQNNMLISSQATATAVQLAGGTNTVAVVAGSGFVTSTTGKDVIIFHADQAQTTWNTVVGFGAGDSVTIFGFNAATGRQWWDSSAGAAGYTGATLRLDRNGDGVVDSSVTFAGKTLGTTQFHVVPGNVGGSDYLLVTAS